MKIKFESDEDLINFVKAASLPWDERLSPVAALDFALSELEQFEFMRRDMIARAHTVGTRLLEEVARMTQNLNEFEKEQKEIKEQEHKRIAEASSVPQTQASQ